MLWSCAYEYFGARPTYLAGAALVAATGSLLLPRLDVTDKAQDESGEP